MAGPSWVTVRLVASIATHTCSFFFLFLFPFPRLAAINTTTFTSRISRSRQVALRWLRSLARQSQIASTCCPLVWLLIFPHLMPPENHVVKVRVHPSAHTRRIASLRAPRNPSIGCLPTGTEPFTIWAFISLRTVCKTTGHSPETTIVGGIGDLGWSSMIRKTR